MKGKEGAFNSSERQRKGGILGGGGRTSLWKREATLKGWRKPRKGGDRCLKRDE